MTSNRNRTAGHNWEREIVRRYNEFGHVVGEEFQRLFPEVGTTRLHNPHLDSLKVDITTVDPEHVRKFGLAIQAKSTTNTPQYPKLISQMEEGIKGKNLVPVIYHKQTQKVADGKRFMTRGEYVILKANDFEDMLTSKATLSKAYDEVMTYFDSFSEETQEELHKFLTQLNL